MKSFLPNFLMGAGVSLLLLAAVVSTSPASYLYCLSKEGAWMESETRRELEGQLGLYSSEDVTPNEKGTRKVRYLVFYREPLVVTYAHDGRIEDILLEYE